MDNKNELFSYHKNALLNNLCKEWDGRWNKCHDDKEKLVRLALNQQSLPHFINFSYRGLGLSKEYILEEFKDYINGKYKAINADDVAGGYKSELFVGCDEEIKGSDDVAAFMWCKTGLSVEKCKATKIYVGCDSELNLSCSGYNSVVVMLFDDSTLTLGDIDKESTVIIYRYSEKSNVEVTSGCLTDKVRCFNKELRL